MSDEVETMWLDGAMIPMCQFRMIETLAALGGCSMEKQLQDIITEGLKPYIAAVESETSKRKGA